MAQVDPVSKWTGKMTFNSFTEYFSLIDLPSGEEEGKYFEMKPGLMQ
jgi:hypothetical protein